MRGTARRSFRLYAFHPVHSRFQMHKVWKRDLPLKTCRSESLDETRSMGAPECCACYGTKTFSRTCHLVLAPGFNVTIPVSIEPHSFPKGSAKLNWSSTATKFLAGGA